MVRPQLRKPYLMTRAQLRKRRLVIRPAHKALVEAYLADVDLDVVRAYMRINHCTKGRAQRVAALILERPEVADYLSARVRDRNRDSAINPEAVVQMIHAEAVKPVDGKIIKQSDRLRAIELLAKHTGVIQEGIRIDLHPVLPTVIADMSGGDLVRWLGAQDALPRAAPPLALPTTEAEASSIPASTLSEDEEQV